MIQRVQSIYLVIVMVVLSIITFSTDFFSYLNATSKFSFSSYGLTEYAISDGTLVSHTPYPLYISTIGLTLLTFICLMSYKNLNRQRTLGRYLFYIYFLFVVGMIIWSMLGSSMIDAQTETREMGTGFFLFICGFPFTFMANIGIKRDKNLLASLDRLR